MICDSWQLMDWICDCEGCGSDQNVDSCDDRFALWGHEWAVVATWAAERHVARQVAIRLAASGKSRGFASAFLDSTRAGVGR